MGEVVNFVFVIFSFAFFQYQNISTVIFSFSFHGPAFCEVWCNYRCRADTHVPIVYCMWGTAFGELQYIYSVYTLMGTTFSSIFEQIKEFHWHTSYQPYMAHFQSSLTPQKSICHAFNKNCTGGQLLQLRWFFYAKRAMQSGAVQEAFLECLHKTCLRLLAWTLVALMRLDLWKFL